MVRESLLLFNAHIKELVELTIDVMSPTQKRTPEQPLDENSQEFRQLEELVLQVGAKLTYPSAQERLLEEYEGETQDLLRYLVLNCNVWTGQIICAIKGCDVNLAVQLTRQWYAENRLCR